MSEKAHPPVNSIIRCEDFHYLYVGSYHQLNQAPKSLVNGGAGMMTHYDPDDPDYLYVKAVFLDNGKFYFIPSTFSDLGTLDPKKENRPYFLRAGL